LVTAALFVLLPALVQAQFTFITNDDNAITITGYSGTNLNVTIPDTINGRPVTSLGDMALFACPGLTSVTIGTNVTNIGYQAFFMSAISNLTLPAGLVNLGDKAFYSCTRLTNIIIPDRFTRIGDQAFYMCSSLTSVTIGTSVNSVGNEAFRSCTNLTRVVLPNNLTSIGVGAFYDCASLTDISIPGRVTNIGNFAFAVCSHLASVAMPTNIDCIHSDLFADCTSLTSIKIPESVNKIEDYAFYFSGLTNVMISYSVTNIGISAFAYCPGLSVITVDENNPSYSSVSGVLFNKCQTMLMQFPGGKAGSYTIPNSVTNIWGAVFYGCSKLTNVAIGINVTSIPDGLFEHCTNLISITIPSGVTSIGIFAFLGCSSLANVTIPGTVTNIGNQAFSYCPNLTSLYFAGNAPANVGLNPIDTATVYYLPGTTGWEEFAELTDVSVILWNPQVRTSDGNFGKGANGFGFNIAGTVNIPTVVEAATNLVDAPWTLIQSCTLTNGLFYFSDPQWTNYPNRFYHLRSP